MSALADFNCETLESPIDFFEFKFMVNVIARSLQGSRDAVVGASP